MPSKSSYTKTVTETKCGTKHQWTREEPNGNKCMVTIINPTAAQLAVINRFTGLANAEVSDDAKRRSLH